MPTETYVFSQDSELKLGFLEVHLCNPRPEKQSRQGCACWFSGHITFQKPIEASSGKGLRNIIHIVLLLYTVEDTAEHPCAPPLWASSLSFSTNTQASLQSPGLEAPPSRHTQGHSSPIPPLLLLELKQQLVLETWSSSTREGGWGILLYSSMDKRAQNNSWKLQRRYLTLQSISFTFLLTTEKARVPGPQRPMDTAPTLKQTLSPSHTYQKYFPTCFLFL